MQLNCTFLLFRWWNFLTVNLDFQHDKEVEEKCTTEPFCDREIVPLLDTYSIHGDMDVATKHAYLKKSTLIEGESNRQCVIH
jgi:hypothetical protein